MPTIADLHRVAFHARDPSVQSHLNCGAVSTTIRDALNETFGPIADVAIGKVTESPSSRLTWGEEHAFVFVPVTYVAEGTNVILDGTLDQFRISLYEDGYVDVWFLPEEEFPPRVSVLTANGTATPSALQGLYEQFWIEKREGPLTPSP